jgi:hypothetical protein
MESVRKGETVVEQVPLTDEEIQKIKLEQETVENTSCS